MSITRYSVNNPERIHLPDEDGPCVSYADHAPVAAENAALKARVAELEHLQSMKAPDYLQETLKKENSDLRAQLEAAKAQLTAQPDGVDWRKLAEDAWNGWRIGKDIVTPMHALRDALAAAPAREDGVREAAVWLCSCVDKARRSGFGMEHEELLDLVEQVEEALVREQALAAPAPAYDPKPDWRCQACEETGARHCSEPERCGNMKPPAPAREGGVRKAFQCPACGAAIKAPADVSESLERYGWHDESCPDFPTRRRPLGICNCGFSQALSAPAPATRTQDDK